MTGARGPVLRGRGARSGEVITVSSLADLGRDQWDDLVRASRAPVFYSWDFLAAIERQPLTDGAEPFYLAVRGSDGLTAATVVYRQRAVNPFGPPGAPAEPMLVGHLWHCYDTRLLSAGPVTAGLLGAIAQALDQLADEVGAVSRGLHNLDLTGPVAAAAGQDKLAAGSPRYRLVPGPGANRDDHLAGLGPSSRRTMRKYLRRASEAGLKVSFEPAGASLDEAVLRMCLATADKHAPGYYPPEPLAALLRALGPDCRILRLELGGQLIACSVCLLDATAAHFWAGGSCYPDDLNWSPQYVLFGEELAHGFAAGREVVEFGRRNDEFKARHGLTPHRLASWVWGD